VARARDSVASLVSTRPFPVLGGFTQPGFDRIPLYIPDYLFPLIAVSNPTVEIVLRPKGSGMLHDPVRLKCRSPFEPPDLPRQQVSRARGRDSA